MLYQERTALICSISNLALQQSLYQEVITNYNFAINIYRNSYVYNVATCTMSSAAVKSVCLKDERSYKINISMASNNKQSDGSNFTPNIHRYIIELCYPSKLLLEYLASTLANTRVLT